jgi:predicted DsbA family dithiol-disulfide isomerase
VLFLHFILLRNKQIMYRSLTLLLCGIACFYACAGQHKKTVMKEKTANPLLCDPATGVCTVPGDSTATGSLESVTPVSGKVIKVLYFTDPICSSCWGIEPQLRKLKLEYGHAIDIEYRMGGLLPDWSYNSGGISKPGDVAHHWDEVSQYYQMPIDGDVWLEDPLSSSYPPSIAFKAAQMQDPVKAIAFLRRIREMVFLEKKNITKWEHLSAAAQQTGLDTTQLHKDYEGPAVQLFRADLDLAKTMQVRGFPTLFFRDNTGNQLMVYGFKPYEAFDGAIRQLAPETRAKAYDHQAASLFAHYPTLTDKEFASLAGCDIQEARTRLQQLAAQQQAHPFNTKNGILWVYAPGQ